MRTFLAKWPSGGMTILTAKSSEDLFNSLDMLDDPSGAEIFLFPRNFSLDLEVKDGAIVINTSPCDEMGGHEPKRWIFPDDIFGAVFFDRKKSFTHELLNDGVHRKHCRDRKKLKQIRKQKLTLKPLQMLGAIKGINELAS